MAKLNGVKTIDMVNGEITKVSYGGSEYVKTDDTRETAKVGDLFLATKGKRDITVGAFYEVIPDDLGRSVFGDINILDDAEDTHDTALNYGEFFRKISAEQSPTIEERVEALEADVASIKGEAKATTKRLTVGDKARVVGRESAHSAEIGDIVTIVRDDEDRQPYKCELDGENVGWFQESELEAVGATKQEPEIVEAVKPKLKAGDFVKFVGYGDLMAKFDLTFNKAYEVVESGGYLAIVDDVGMARIAPLRKAPYEILSAEEVAKHRESEKWAKIGRKPGEFKVGDIAEVVEYNRGHKVGTIVKITGVDNDGDSNAVANGVTYYYHPKRLKLIAPVDARFDK